MKKIHKMLCLLGKTVVATLVSLVILSFFTFFYKFTPVRVVTNDGATDYKWKPNSYLNTMEEGFAILKTDSNGYNNAYPYSDNSGIDILLMGSSHMLAAEVGEKENTGYLLNDYLPYTTYNIGMAGHFLATSISNLSTAISLFNPKRYIIIETDSLVVKEEDLRLVITDQYPDVESSSSRIIAVMQVLFPATKKLAIQLNKWREADKRTVQESENILNERLYSELFDKIDSIIGDKQLIIVYNPNTFIDVDGKIKDNADAEYRDLFERESKIHGMHFIDMTEEYAQFYSQTNILPHGFINSAVGSGHINRYGHQLIAKCVAEVIMEEQ